MRLAPLTTLRLGGPARGLIEAHTEDELVAAVRARPALLLAGGSNVVIADDGVPGTVVLVRTRGVERDGDLLVVQAGEPWDELVARCVQDGLQGFECLSGIPGSTGATPIQNVGAYGQEVAETVAWVRVYDRERDAVVTLDAAECGFEYRRSIFKYRDRWTVLAVAFRMTESELSGPLRYAELARALDVPVGGRAPLAEVRAAVLGLRRRKGMVIDPDDPDSVSAGSFFTNPILTHEAWSQLPDAPALPGARRADQDLGRVADRARRLHPRLRPRRRRHLQQAHARARQPRRRHDRGAARARARDRRRRARTLRRRAGSRAGAGRRDNGSMRRTSGPDGLARRTALCCVRQYMRLLTAAVVSLSVLALAPAVALAAPPPNDNYLASIPITPQAENSPPGRHDRGGYAGRPLQPQPRRSAARRR